MAAIVLFALLATAQETTIFPQCNTFNSTFSLSSDLLNQAGLDSTTANNVDVAIRFEQTNWATGSVHSDSFYTVPPNSADKPPGSILKVEDYTNTTLYTLPPNVALSRILFQSETFNGSATPASAYVLWPWMPRIDPKTGKYAVVGWGHGTSGVYGECAPSHIRNLWYQYSAPYILALQGYVVVAPDYAGLGIDISLAGTQIRHPYLNNVAAANDLFHAVQAAHRAFPDELSSRFVLMGHSQGGGAAWGAAQRQSMRPVEGYLGAIAGSPVTNVITQLKYLPSTWLPFGIGYGLPETIAGFHLSDFLTENGLRYAKLLRGIEGCNSAAFQLAAEENLVKSEWEHTPYMELFVNLTGNGGRPISGPMLVLQGTADTSVPYEATDQAVNQTCKLYSQSQLRYDRFEGVEHVPVLYASQQIWLDWIWDRFCGREVDDKCTQHTYRPARSVQSYEKQLAYYLEIATQSYEVA